MADPYAASLGFGGTTAPVAPGDPYAAALGFTDAPKTGRAPGANKPPTLTFNDPAEARAQLVAHGDPALLAEFDKQFSTPSAKTLQPAPAAPAGVPGTNAGIPGAVPTSGPGPLPDWWDKAKAVGQAVVNTAAGTVGGAGMLYGGLEGVGENVGSLLSGNTPKMDVEQQAMLRAQQFTPELPQAMQTPLGREYTGNVGQFIQTHGPSIIGPEVGLLAEAMRPAARAGMDTMRAQFAEKQGMPVRVDPTMGKPRYGVVDGKIQRIDQPNVDMTVRIPGQEPVTSTPTLAEATPELQSAITKAREAGSTSLVVEARHIEADTLPIPIKLTKGQATIDPSLMSAEMNGRGKTLPLVSPEFYKQQGQAVAKNMDAFRAAAAPDVPPTASMVDHGQSLLDAYKQMDAPIRAEITAKYKALSDANGGTLPLSGTDFVHAADQALAKANKGYFVPAEVKSLMSDYRDGGPMTFDSFENLRTILGAEERKYAGKDGNAAHAISLVRDSLESLPMTGEAEAIKPLADAARKAAAIRFAAIKSDPAYKAAVTDSVGVGEPSPLADKFFNSYVTKSPRANLALMREHLASDPIAGQTIAAGTLDQLKSQLKANPDTGNFSQDSYNRALKALDPKINSLLDPKTAQQVQALGNVTALIQQQARGSFVNNSNTFTAMAASKAATALEKAGNMVVPGLGAGTDIRDALARRAAAKAGNDSIAPGAGVSGVKDFPR